MSVYAKKELMSSTEIVRNFSSVLDSIRERRVEKVAILRKNKIEAVIIPIEEYEKIQSDSQCLEHMHIYRQLKEREGTQLEEYIDFDTLLADYGLRKDEL